MLLGLENVNQFDGCIKDFNKTFRLTCTQLKKSQCVSCGTIRLRRVENKGDSISRG